MSRQAGRPPCLTAKANKSQVSTLYILAWQRAYNSLELYLQIGNLRKLYLCSIYAIELCQSFARAQGMEATEITWYYARNNRLSQVTGTFKWVSNRIAYYGKKKNPILEVTVAFPNHLRYVKIKILRKVLKKKVHAVLLFIIPIKKGIISSLNSENY